VGGSVAHADPRAELPVALTALGARFHLRSPEGRRALTADELFQGPLTTAIAEGELLESIEVPPLPPGARTGFAEYARTHGDFAQAAVAVVRTPERTTIVTLGPRVVTAVGEHDHASALTAALIREAMPA
jgi:CO/xanthine dehydrogenase FAD-binding subunit